MGEVFHTILVSLGGRKVTLGQMFDNQLVLWT